MEGLEELEELEELEGLEELEELEELEGLEGLEGLEELEGLEGLEGLEELEELEALEELEVLEDPASVEGGVVPGGAHIVALSRRKGIVGIQGKQAQGPAQCCFRTTNFSIYRPEPCPPCVIPSRIRNPTGCLEGYGGGGHPLRVHHSLVICLDGTKGFRDGVQGG